MLTSQFRLDQRHGPRWRGWSPATGAAGLGNGKRHMKLSVDEFAELVDEALSNIPDGLREYMADVTVDIEPRPDRETCADMELDDPSELLGLYQGIPLTDRGLEHDLQLPDRIVIYQRNIERCCRTREEIMRQVLTTVFHEVGHHFGLDEDALEKLGFE